MTYSSSLLFVFIFLIFINTSYGFIKVSNNKFIYNIRNNKLNNERKLYGTIIDIPNQAGENIELHSSNNVNSNSNQS